MVRFGCRWGAAPPLTSIGEGSTMPHSFRVRVLAYAGVLALSLGLVGGTLPASGASYDKTSAREKKRVDSVPTPKLKWATCSRGSNAPR